MDDKIEKLKNEFSYLKIEKDSIFDDDDIYYKISNLNGNKNISLSLYKEENIDDLTSVLKVDPYLLEEYLGVKYEDKYEIMLSPISNKYLPTSVRNSQFEIQLNYYKNELHILIESNIEGKPVTFFNNHLNRFSITRRNFTLTIENFSKPTSDGLNSDLRNILNSVLFDLEYSFNVSFEAIELNSLNNRIPKLKRQALPIPNHLINFTFKRYIPELIQYFHLAEKVEYIPFKYLCFFHIIEYFSDKSAYYVIAEQIKQLLLKPDFHLKSDAYINKAVNIFRKENEKHLTDKIKLNRVLQQFINMGDFIEYLQAVKLYDHFTKEQEFSCSKPFKVPALDFTNETTFFQSLASRIYSIRCSIVHSNPDFDETRAIPFVHNSENVFRLNIEIALVYEISRTIIVRSSETK